MLSSSADMFAFLASEPPPPPLLPSTSFDMFMLDPLLDASSPLLMPSSDVTDGTLVDFPLDLTGRAEPVSLPASAHVAAPIVAPREECDAPAAQPLATVAPLPSTAHTTSTTAAAGVRPARANAGKPAVKPDAADELFERAEDKLTTRKRSSCVACTRQHRKCSGGNPCVRCLSLGDECSYVVARRPGPPRRSKVSHLLASDGADVLTCSGGDDKRARGSPDSGSPALSPSPPRRSGSPPGDWGSALPHSPTGDLAGSSAVVFLLPSAGAEFEMYYRADDTARLAAAPHHPVLFQPPPPSLLTTDMIGLVRDCVIAEWAIADPMSGLSAGHLVFQPRFIDAVQANTLTCDQRLLLLTSAALGARLLGHGRLSLDLTAEAKLRAPESMFSSRPITAAGLHALERLGKLMVIHGHYDSMIRMCAQIYGARQPSESGIDLLLPGTRSRSASPPLGAPSAAARGSPSGSEGRLSLDLADGATSVSAAAAAAAAAAPAQDQEASAEATPLWSPERVRSVWDALQCRALLEGDFFRGATHDHLTNLVARSEQYASDLAMVQLRFLILTMAGAGTMFEVIRARAQSADIPVPGPDVPLPPLGSTAPAPESLRDVILSLLRAAPNCVGCLPPAAVAASGMTPSQAVQFVRAFAVARDALRQFDTVGRLVPRPAVRGADHALTVAEVAPESYRLTAARRRAALLQTVEAMFFFRFGTESMRREAVAASYGALQLVRSAGESPDQMCCNAGVTLYGVASCLSGLISYAPPAEAMQHLGNLEQLVTSMQLSACAPLSDCATMFTSQSVAQHVAELQLHHRTSRQLA